VNRVQGRVSMMRNSDLWQWLTLSCLFSCVDQGYSAGKSEFTGAVSGVLQVFNTGAVELAGELQGLQKGQFGLKLVRGKCGEGGEQLRELVRLQSEGEEDTISVKIEKPDDSLDGAFDTSVDLSLVVEGCVPLESEADCDVGDTVACAELVWDQGLSMEIIIIIVVAILIFLIIVICIPIICCCCRKRKSKGQIPALEEDLDSLDDPFQLDGRSKSPMYDELSLPFIDASLPPTPRIGRTVNGLDILLGNNTGSTNSFADP